LGLGTVARHEIRAHRQIHRRSDAGDVGKVAIAVENSRVTGVWQALRKREASAGRRQGWKSQMLQITRGAHVPWIRDHETSTFMKGAKGGAAGDQRRGRESGRSE